MKNDYKVGDIVEYEGVMCPVECAQAHWYRVHKMHHLVALADDIKQNKKLEKLILRKNYLRTNRGGEILGDMLKINTTLKELDVSENGLSIKNNVGGNGPAFATGIADGLSTNSTLVKVNISANAIASQEAGQALAEALKTNTVLKELDVSDNMQKDYSGCIVGGTGPGFAKELAVGVSANRTLTSLNISNNTLTHGKLLQKQTYDEEGDTVDEAVYETDVSGVVALADSIKNNSALTSLNVSNNSLWENWSFSSGQWWVNGGYPPGYPKGDCKEKPHTTNQGFFALCDAIKTNGALVKLNMSKNRIEGAEAGKALGDALAANTVLEELDLSENYSGPEFAKEFAVGLGANGALTSLNISNNGIAHCNSLPSGWSLHLEKNADYRYKHIDGRHQENPPNEAKSTGVIAIANVIKPGGVLTSINLAEKNLSAKGITRITTDMDEYVRNVLRFD